MSCTACRALPAVVPKDYSPKGSFHVIAGLNTYVTGTPESATGIVDIYDVFGLASQTIQGADLLAASLNALVVLPDFFLGDAAKHEWVPADTDEKIQALMGFASSKADIATNVGVLLNAVQEYKTLFPSVKSWGAFGLCWGGKVAALASGPNPPFAATGQAHPGRMDKADAEKLTIPHLVLASKDEPTEAVQGYKSTMEKNGIGGVVETYETMWHGWMGARADLKGETSLAEYIRGYAQAADFFDKHLK